MGGEVMSRQSKEKRGGPLLCGVERRNGEEKEWEHTNLREVYAEKTLGKFQGQSHQKLSFLSWKQAIINNCVEEAASRRHDESIIENLTQFVGIVIAIDEALGSHGKGETGWGKGETRREGRYTDIDCAPFSWI
ncbi:hypothetical protein LXL04_034225 [Taraxacum kok-saghyz]